MTNVVVIGQGYVGLPMALRAAEAGFTVAGLDTSEQVVELLSRGRSHIGDVSDHELSAVLASGRYTATADELVLTDADTIVVCVPTPLSSDGGPDLGAVIGAGRVIGRYARPGTLVILESTTYPGTTEEVFAPLVLGSEHTLDDIHIAFSPERINPGDPVYGVKNTPKVVGGLTAKATESAHAFYSHFVDTVINARRAREAEMAKLLENTFRHVNIALVNEMLRFCQELDIDLWNAIDCAETKPFGYMAFRPGPGVGGHCIPVDPSYLSHRVKAKLGYAFRMVELAEEINHAAPDYVAERTWLALNEKGLAIRGSRILLVGVTYKPDVADLRESPAEPLATRLRSWGADISYHDPFVPSWSFAAGQLAITLNSEPDLAAAAAAADLTILLQQHCSIELDSLRNSAAMLLDTRGVLPVGPNIVRL